MEILFGNKDILELLCKSKGKPALLLHNGSSAAGEGEEEVGVAELSKAVPFLDRNQVMTLLFEGPVYIFCDSLEEIRDLYNQVVGEDGPTKVNPYNGPARVYALTCDKDGLLGTENT